ncbi:hypothetical protein FQZ97_970050 [compost metagenome]
MMRSTLTASTPTLHKRTRPDTGLPARFGSVAMPTAPRCLGRMAHSISSSATACLSTCRSEYCQRFCRSWVGCLPLVASCSWQEPPTAFRRLKSTPGGGSSTTCPVALGRPRTTWKEGSSPGKCFAAFQATPSLMLKIARRRTSTGRRARECPLPSVPCSTQWMW